MATNAEKSRIVMAFHHETDDQVVTTMGAVDDGVYGHLDRFTNVIVDKATFQAQRLALSTAVVAAKDGGRIAIAEKNKQRRLSTKMLSKLARYVEEIADNDPTTLTLSGFVVKTGNPASQATAQSAIHNLKQTASGEITAQPTPVPDAGMYEVHGGVPGPGGAAPTSWITLQISASRPGAVFKNLIPGTLYAFQVRAFVKSAWTEWSDIVIKMST